MNRIISMIATSAIALIFLPGVLSAQKFTPDQRERIQERIEAQRVAFITRELDLTPDESAAFWPLYNEFKAEEEKKRKSVSPGTRPENMSDQEAADFIEKQLQVDEEMVGVKREYFKKISAVIGAQRLVSLHRIEREFNRNILERLRARESGQK